MSTIKYWGRIVIEWPTARGDILAAWQTSILDDETGKQIKTVSQITVTAPANDLVTADLVMFADEDGKPVFDGAPYIKDGEVVTATFPFLVAEMRVRPAA